jgi:hypothetical protein
MFSNRNRLYDLTRDADDLESQFRWETINAILYKVGGVLFIVGSILFFPRFEAYADMGVWTFFFGSLLYLVVTGGYQGDKLGDKVQRLEDEIRSAIAVRRFKQRTWRLLSSDSRFSDTAGLAM